jgi:hypothetical protein
MVQPLDVSINRPFKDRLRNAWKNWISIEIENKIAEIEETGYTTENDGNVQFRIRPPKKQDVVEWIEKAWYDTKPNIVTKAFLCTGISNNLDSTEDDLLTVDLSIFRCKKIMY